jgi:hypothetical protein
VEGWGMGMEGCKDGGMGMEDFAYVTIGDRGLEADGRADLHCPRKSKHHPKNGRAGGSI